MKTNGGSFLRAHVPGRFRDRRFRRNSVTNFGRILWKPQPHEGRLLSHGKRTAQKEEYQKETPQDEGREARRENRAKEQAVAATPSRAPLFPRPHSPERRGELHHDFEDEEHRRGPSFRRLLRLLRLRRSHRPRCAARDFAVRISYICMICHPCVPFHVVFCDHQ